MSRFNNTCVEGFLLTQGCKMVTGKGEEVLLRGWGAGNWTNPEGFMLGIGTGYMGASMNPGLSIPGRFTSGRTMNAVIRELCGTEYVEAEIHRAPLNTDVPENCRSYGKNNIDETESVLILRDANGSERFFWYSKDYVFCDIDGAEIEYARFTYDCFVAQAQDNENHLFIVHISE